MKKVHYMLLQMINQQDKIMDNIDNMARIEREIEKRMEDACEKSLAHVGTSKRVQELAA